MAAAEDGSLSFDTMTDDAAAAVHTCGSEVMDGALETVKDECLVRDGNG
jgi:hypothetical protein